MLDFHVYAKAKRFVQTSAVRITVFSVTFVISQRAGFQKSKVQTAKDVKDGLFSLLLGLLTLQTLRLWPKVICKVILPNTRTLKMTKNHIWAQNHVSPV